MDFWILILISLYQLPLPFPFPFTNYTMCVFIPVGLPWENCEQGNPISSAELWLMCVVNGNRNGDCGTSCCTRRRRRRWNSGFRTNRQPRRSSVTMTTRRWNASAAASCSVATRSWLNASSCPPSFSTCSPFGRQVAPVTAVRTTWQPATTTTCPSGLTAFVTCSRRTDSSVKTAADIT